MPQIDVARVVVTCGPEVLLLERVPHDEFRGGQLDLPGGRVDPGEDGAFAAARELGEEAGIVIDPTMLEEIESYVDPKNGLLKAVYHAVLARKPKQIVTDPREHTGGAWYPEDVAREIFTHAFYGGAMRKVFDGRKVGVATGAA